MEFEITYLILAAVFGLFMAWGIGANDVANAMATSVGSKAITLKKAIIIAAIFEFAGAVLAGGEVTSTIRKGIIDSNMLTSNGDIFILGMLASLLAAGTWLLIATKMGWPVSTTHSIVGAIVGFAIVAMGFEAVKWGKIGTIAASWVASPLLSGTIAFLLFKSVQKLILNSSTPFENAKKYVPFYIFGAGFFIALVTIFKGLKHLKLDITGPLAYGIATAVGVVVMLLGMYLVSKVKYNPSDDKSNHYASVEKIFGVLMIFTACAMAFAHGSNDVANAVGPVAAVVSTVSSGGSIVAKSQLPIWVLLLGGGGIVLGLMTFGYKVIQTVGRNITELTPSRGFTCEIAAAATVVLASGTGIPISTTHTLVGAVLGVGIARGIAALDLGVVRTIAMSWVITLPVGGTLAVIFFYVLKTIFGI